MIVPRRSRLVGQFARADAVVEDWRFGLVTWHVGAGCEAST